MGKAFIHLGLRPGHGVGIIGFNSPEWFFAGAASIVFFYRNPQIQMPKIISWNICEKVVLTAKKPVEGV